PPMNFLGAKVARNAAGQAEIVLGAARLALPLERQTACGKLDGRAVEFGIRPEDITLEAVGNASAALAATVVVVEPLGAETLVIFQCEGGELTARLPPTFALAPGQQVTVQLDMEKFHLFDPQGGAVLPSR
ncbi:TOBE domain-containing protein, partial [Janthinobacterium sp. KBS0711]